MHMKHKLENDTRLVKGLVLDHGGRHPDMPKRLENCFILTCNISLEFEKSELAAGFFYSNAEEREKLIAAERAVTDDRVKQIIDLKRQVLSQKTISIESVFRFAIQEIKRSSLSIRKASILYRWTFWPKTVF